MLGPSVPGRCLNCCPSIFLSPKKLEKKACLIAPLPVCHTKNPLGLFLLKENQAWVRKLLLRWFSSQTQMGVRWWRIWNVSWVLSPPAPTQSRASPGPGTVPAEAHKQPLPFFTVSDPKIFFFPCFLPHQNWTWSIQYLFFWLMLMWFTILHCPNRCDKEFESKRMTQIIWKSLQAIPEVFFCKGN